MRHHFLFGAGASGNSGGCDPNPPPVGNELFADLKGTLLLAMYHKSKAVRDCPHVIKQVRSRWAASLNSTEKLFVIGTRLVTDDIHIWEPIAKFKGELCWVSPDVPEARAWALEHDLKFVEYATTFKEFLVRYESEPSHL